MRIVAVGDLMLGDSPTTVGYGFRSRYGDSSIYEVFRDLTTAFAGADLVLGNLEVMLPSGQFDPSDRSSAQMRGHPRYAVALKEAGFDILNVANNHADQHGEEGFRETVARLNESGIACCGLKGSGRWYSEPVKVDRAGNSLGVLGYSLRSPQYGNDSPPYAQGPLEHLLKDVQRLTSEVDHVILSLHWGEEFVHLPSESEVEVGRELISAGASLILGHHPHVSRPVERWERGVVAYSLGNTISDMIWQERLRKGLLLSAEFSQGSVEQVRVCTTRVSDDYAPAVDGRWTDVPQEPVSALSEKRYRRSVRRSLNLYRAAAYWHALRKIHATPPRVVIDLVRETLRNKLNAVLRRVNRGV